VSHGGQEVKLDDVSEGTSFFSVQDIETFLLNELSGNLKSDLITLLVLGGHSKIIKEDSHILTI
jgi:hypothetical protein